MASVLVEIYQHNLWANLRLLDSCKKLTDKQMGSGIVGTRGSIAITLHHIFSAEERYASRLTGATPKKWLGDLENPSLTQLRTRAKASGKALCEAAGQAKAGKVIKTVFDSKNYEVYVEVILVQVINHANEHRAQVMTTMTQIGAPPPDLSAWTWAEATKKMSVK